MTAPARLGSPSIALALATLATLATAAGCRDVQRFSTAGDHFEGSVVRGDFVRAGIGGDVRLCLTLDTDHLQDAPGAISSSDGRFAHTPLRPIPQLWHDPLSTFDFGEGRIKNMMYMAAPAEDGGAADVTVVVSLMQGGGVEVRLVRGAPRAPDAPAPADNLFAVFALGRVEGPCPL